jgi:hypothetical protein
VHAHRGVHDLTAADVHLGGIHRYSLDRFASLDFRLVR